MTSNTELRDRASDSTIYGRLLLFLNHPLGVYWALFAVAAVGAVVQWLILDQSPREALGAAAVIAVVTSLVARVRGVSPWPPLRARSIRDPHRTD